MRERRRLLPLWRELGLADKRFTEAAETALTETAEGILGLALAEVEAIPRLGEAPPPPAGQTAWHYWFWRACRRIEAYNRTLRRHLSAAEFANVEAVNHYRELLGVLPMEIDLRLVQAARRHAKEMADLDYFAHNSPKADHRTPTMRVKQAGYPGGAAENIGAGFPSAKAAFWAWFDSPGHHKNMAAERHAAVGVGRWGSKWTQNFGSAPRLMLADEETRRKVAVQGPLLPPRG